MGISQLKAICNLTFVLQDARGCGADCVLFVTGGKYNNSCSAFMFRWPRYKWKALGQQLCSKALWQHSSIIPIMKLSFKTQTFAWMNLRRLANWQTTRRKMCCTTTVFTNIASYYSKNWARCLQETMTRTVLTLPSTRSSTTQNTTNCHILHRCQTATFDRDLV